MTEADATNILMDWSLWAREKQLPPPGDWRIWLLLAGRGFGKLLSTSTPIPVPSGWTTMGELQIGDQVFDESGTPCKVVWVSDETIPEVAYRLHFSDGSFIDACSEHQWVTWTHAERKSYLRSPYENTTRFPDNWPQWRLGRIVGRYAGKEIVEQALQLYQAGFSIRAIARKLGVARNSLTPHIKAGRYLERQPRVYADSPGPRVRTTQAIVDTLYQGKRNDVNHCIPQCLPLVLPDSDLPIPPYVLGAWLGDGDGNGGTFTQHEGDMLFLRAQIESEGFVTTSLSDSQRFGTRGLSPLLRQQKLIKNKHVPEIYLRASVAQRLALLQGLMDTDGTVGKQGYCEFSNTNARLTDAVYELIVSLGMRATKSLKIPRLNGKICSAAYRIKFIPTIPIFRLPRKLRRLNFDGKQSLRRYHRMIVGAERIQPVPMRCITVDSPNGMYLAGEAMIPTHNTLAITQWALAQAKAMPGSRGALVAPTAGDARDVLVEGVSGILTIAPPDFMPTFEPSRRRLTFPNGSRATLFSADEPNRLRGPQHHWAICDEIAAWQYPEAFDMLLLGLRLGANPRAAIATTPRPVAFIKRLLSDETVAVVRGSTYENRLNLAPAFFKGVARRYEGTRLGRQELLGEILDESAGALFKLSLIEASRVSEPPDLRRIVVAIDPAVTATRDSDEIGIVVAGVDAGGHGYVLEDASLKASPDGWARAAVEAYRRWSADRIVAEVNNGGILVEETIRTVDANIPFASVWASRGKRARAEPVAALYEQGKIHHAGIFEDLERQMCEGTAKSPDRVDALVWAITELMLREDEEIVIRRGRIKD